MEGSPLIDPIDAHTYRRIREDAGEALATFVTPEGTLEAPLVGHVLAAREQPA